MKERSFVSMKPVLSHKRDMSTPKRDKFSGIVPYMGLPIDKILADNLTALFERRGITSAAKAESTLNIPKSTIDRAWHQRSMTKVDTLADLASALKLEPWQLLVPNINPSRPPKLAEGQAKQPVSPNQFDSDEIIELLVLFQQLAPQSRDMVLDFVKSTIKKGAILRWRRVADNDSQS